MTEKIAETLSDEDLYGPWLWYMYNQPLLPVTQEEVDDDQSEATEAHKQIIDAPAIITAATVSCRRHGRIT